MRGRLGGGVQDGRSRVKGQLIEGQLIEVERAHTEGGLVASYV